MAEYINREDAIKMITEDLPEAVYYSKEDAIECLECLPTADVVPKSEVITLYDRIKAMPLDEMVSFFAYLYKNDIIATADRYICRKCKAEHGGHCPIGDDDKCLYDLSDKETIKLWLEMGAYEWIGDTCVKPIKKYTEGEE